MIKRLIARFFRREGKAAEMNGVSKGDLPPGWGKDSVTEFLDVTRTNELANFANQPEYRKILGVNDGLQAAVDATYLVKAEVALVPTMLLRRSHSSYLGATRAVMGGQVAETYPLLRLSLEASLYGHHVVKDKNRAVIWLRRHDDAGSKKRCRAEFAYRKVLRTLEQVDGPLAGLVDKMYETLIDFGGHPNPHSIGASMQKKAGEAVDAWDVLYADGNSVVVRATMKNCARLGVLCLKIFSHVFPTQAASIGMKEKIDRLSDRL